MHKRDKRYDLETILGYRKDAETGVTIAQLELMRWDLHLRLGKHPDEFLVERALFEDPQAIESIKLKIKLNRSKRILRARGAWNPKNSRRIRTLFSLRAASKCK